MPSTIRQLTKSNPDSDASYARSRSTDSLVDYVSLNRWGRHNAKLKRFEFSVLILTVFVLSTVEAMLRCGLEIRLEFLCYQIERA